jgi:hypothetical protein
MGEEFHEISQGMDVLHRFKDDVEHAAAVLNKMSARISQESTFLGKIIERDAWLSTTNGRVCKENQLCLTLSMASLPRIRVNASELSPRKGPGGAPSAMPHAVEINGENWPQVIAETLIHASVEVKSSSALRLRVEQELLRISQRCDVRRGNVVHEQHHYLDQKLQGRARLLREIDYLERSIDEARNLWKSASETAKTLKEPMLSSEQRHQVRETATDNVGINLVEERNALARRRHEMKKRCRALQKRTDELKQQLAAKVKALEDIDQEVATRLALPTENPLGVGSRPNMSKIVSIRTFPQLLAPKEIFGKETLSPRYEPSTSSTPTASREGSRRHSSQSMSAHSTKSDDKENRVLPAANSPLKIPAPPPRTPVVAKS